MKHEKLRIPTMLLAVWMLIVSIPVTTFAELLQMTTEPMTDDTVYVLAEDQSKRTAFEKHYYCSDGTFVAVTYPEAVHYQNEQGEWVDVDLRLSDHSFSDTYESQSGDFKASFSKPSTSTGDASVMSVGSTNASTPAVTLESGDYALSWSLIGTKPAGVSAGTYAINGASAGQTAILTASTQADVQVLGEFKTAQPAVNVQKVAVTDPDAFALPSASNQIIYENIFGEDQNVSVRYSVSQNRVEEDFLITAPTDMTSFSMQVECTELTPVLNLDNSVDFLDNNGEMVYHVSTPYLADAAFAVSYDVQVTLTEQDGICIITYTPDAEWMNDSARVYPIMLDPAVTTKDYSYAIHDTYLVEGDDTVHYTEQYLNISQNDGKGRAAILRFASLPQIDSSMPIISATLKLPTYIGPNGVDLKLESMSDGFNFLTDRYSDWKTWNRTEIDSVSYTSGTIMFEFDMTSCIVDLYSGSIGRDFSISLTDEDATTYVSPIFSADATFGDSYRPYLTVTYGYTLPESLSADDVIQIQNVNSKGYLYPNGGLIGNGNAVVHAPATTSGPTNRSATLTENASTGAYKIECAIYGNPSSVYYSADTTTQRVVMYNTSSVPSNIDQDWLIIPYTKTTFKIVLASDMRYVMTADLNDESKSVSITQCNGTPTDAQLWMIYKDDQAVTNTIALSALSITTGTYYINNRETGKFINRNATSSYVGTTSGLIEDIGESIDWQITKLPDGYYTIQSAQHPGKLLTALTISATMSTYNGEVTDAQKWQITGTSEQYYIRSVLNKQYLYATTDETASYSLGLQSGNLAPECKWRIVTPGNYVELSEFSCTEQIVVAVGTSAGVQINTISPANTSWAQWVADYEFPTGILGNIVAIDDYGCISGIGQGTVVVNVKHKATGRNMDVTINVVPTFASELTTTGKVDFTHIKQTDDGFYMLDIPLSDIFTVHDITTMYESTDAMSGRLVVNYYDDWYLYAIENSEGLLTYGLIKMREQEYDVEDLVYDSNDPGVSVSFVEFSYSDLILLLLQPTMQHNVDCFDAMYEVMREPGIASLPVYGHDLANYFANHESKGSYLVAERYINKILSKSCNNNEISIPNDYELAENFVKDWAEIYDPDGTLIVGDKIHVTNGDSYNTLSLAEKNLIILTHTGAISMNGFAAEIEVHADVLMGWAIFDFLDDTTIKADLNIAGNHRREWLMGMYNKNHQRIQQHIAAHGEDPEWLR